MVITEHILVCAKLAVSIVNNQWLYTFHG